MQIRIAQDAFSSVLSRAQSVLERKSTRPILENVLLEASGESLTVSATDLRVSMVQVVPCRVDQPGSVAVPGRKIHEIARELPKGEVSLVIKENGWVTASSGKSVFHLPGAPADEYPGLPSLPATRLEIEGDTLRIMLDKTLFATSSDESRMYLCGVYAKAWTDEAGTPLLRMVATDGHRLSLIDRPVGKDLGLFHEGVIIPKKGLAELKGLLEGSTAPLEVAASQGRLFARIGTTTLAVTLIDATFPNYTQVIPTESTHSIQVDRPSFVDALRRVSLLSDQETHSVVVDASPEGLVLSSTNPQLGDAREELEAAVEGGPVRLAFNATYFVEALKVFSGPGVSLTVSDPLAPCVLRDPTEPGFLCVIMPMRIE